VIALIIINNSKVADKKTRHVISEKQRNKLWKWEFVIEEQVVAKIENLTSLKRNTHGL
jgi:hypothetical protein